MTTGAQDRGGNAAAFNSQRDDVFGRIAGRYDLLCDIFSLGLHRRWKRRVAKLIVIERWTCMLDAAAARTALSTVADCLTQPVTIERLHAAVSMVLTGLGPAHWSPQEDQRLHEYHHLRVVPRPDLQQTSNRYDWKARCALRCRRRHAG